VLGSPGRVDESSDSIEHRLESYSAALQVVQPSSNSLSQDVTMIELRPVTGVLAELPTDVCSGFDAAMRNMPIPSSKHASASIDPRRCKCPDLELKRQAQRHRCQRRTEQKESDAGDVAKCTRAPRSCQR